MPRGIYNIKYKIVLTDLHPFHWRMFDRSRRLHYKHWSILICEVDELSLLGFLQLPKKETFGIVCAVASTRFACVTSKAKTQKPTFNQCGYRMAHDSEVVGSLPPGTPSMPGRPEFMSINNSSTGVKTIWGPYPVCRLLAFSRLV